MSTKWVRAYEYAKKMRISRQSVYRMIREGKIPKNKTRTVKMVVKRIEIALPDDN